MSVKPSWPLSLLMWSVILIMLTINASQWSMTQRVRHEITKASRILGFLVWQRQLVPDRDNFSFSSRTRASEDVCVLQYKFDSSAAFRVTAELSSLNLAWKPVIQDAGRNMSVYYLELTIVFSKISPEKFRVHLSGTGGQPFERELLGQVPETWTKGVMNSGTGTALDCSDTRQILSLNDLSISVTGVCE